MVMVLRTKGINVSINSMILHRIMILISTARNLIIWVPVVCSWFE